MAVKIKLKRLGKIRNPQYRIVVADARNKRDGRAIEEIGRYQPKQNPSLIEVDSDRAQYWLGVGAQPTDPVVAILKVTGDWQKFRGEPGADGTLQTAPAKADKRAAFAAAVDDAASMKEQAPKRKAKADRAAPQEPTDVNAELGKEAAEAEAGVVAAEVSETVVVSESETVGDTSVTVAETVTVSEPVAETAESASADESSRS